MISEPEDVLLCQIPGLHAVLLRRLLERWPDAAAILRAPSSELRAAGVPPALISRIVAAPRQRSATIAGLKSLERMGIVSVTYVSAAYPQRLRELAEPPLTLYIQGCWPPPEPSIALVGHTTESDDSTPITTFLSSIQRLGIALYVGDDDLTLEFTGSVCVLPYGALLARSRISEKMRTAVQEGWATLVSVVPINGQSSPASEALALAVHITLADGILHLGGAEPLALELRPATFRWSLEHHVAVPPSFNVLRPDDGGLRQVARALGVHRTATATIQQERLW